jgi:hypothetical protein
VAFIYWGNGLNIVNKLLLAVSFLGATSAAWAQNFGGGVTLGYGHSSVSNGRGDVSTLTLDANGSINFQGGFRLELDGSFSNVDADFLPGDFTAKDFGMNLNYRFDNNIFVGGYFDYTDLDSILLVTFGPEIISYGVSGGYRTDTLNAEAFAGFSENSPDLPSGVDWTDLGFNVQYDISPRISVGGHVVHSMFSGRLSNIDMTSFGVGGRFDIGRGWTGFGGVSRFDIGGEDIGATNYSIGIGYDLENITKVPAYVSLELRHTDFSILSSNINVDTINLGVTIPLGDRHNSIPLNSLASTVIETRHNAISTLFDGIRLTF